MMNPLQESILVHTGYRVPNHDQPCQAKLITDIEHLGPVAADLIRYRLELRVVCEFASEGGDGLEYRLKQCLKHMAHHLYKDVYDRLLKIQHKLFINADRYEIGRDIDKLLSDLMEVDPNAIRRV